VLTHTLHYGLGVFEGVRAYHTAERVAPASSACRSTPTACSLGAHPAHEHALRPRSTLNEAQRAVVRENGLPEAYMRPLAYLGSEGMGLRADNLKVHVMIAAWEWPSYMEPRGARARHQGAHLLVHPPPREHHDVQGEGGRQLHNSMLALREALESGAEEALLLDNEGYVAEGSRGELLHGARRGAPHAGAHLLSRGHHARHDHPLAEEEGLKLVERRITRDEVYIADEAFFTGTAAEVTPIQSLDGRIIGSGTRGPITTRLQQLYFDEVAARRDGHPEWHSFVN
jgi:branched-chain amino acid aminotransferase